MTETTVTVLCGGVGAARFLSGLVEVVAPERVNAIVNTGDDTVLHGLAISPDLDTITYTLAGVVDPERGWGLVGETWRSMEALRRFASIRPNGSAAAPTWFDLGDTDLATHFYRTARLDEGATLTEVADEIARAWGLTLRVLPMTDDRFRTLITVDRDGTLEEVSFQDYFVRLRHGVPVRSIRFDHDDARLTDSARAALTDADVVVIAPSNPLVSIAPIRALPDVDALLAARRRSVVAVSPIIGGTALKGPADRMLTESGFESSVRGVAEMYASVAGTLIVDTTDAAAVPEIRAAGVRCVVTPTIMSERSVAASLATACLRAAFD